MQYPNVTTSATDPGADVGGAGSLRELGTAGKQ